MTGVVLGLSGNVGAMQIPWSSQSSRTNRVIAFSAECILFRPAARLRVPVDVSIEDNLSHFFDMYPRRR